MTDRQPTYPGRVKLIPVEGQENIYDMERADEPTVEGTPLNKQTLLQDATCAILDIPNTSVPNDAFAKLALGIGKYGYVIQVQFTDGQPLEGATITGANTPDGGEAVTDANGQAVVVSAATSITIGVESPYIDIAGASGVVIQSMGILTAQTVTLEAASPYAVIATSGTYHISPFALTYDLCAVGGGGGSPERLYQSRLASPGGGGGYCQNAMGLSVEKELVVLIGSGGTKGGYNSGSEEYVANQGGTTTVTINGEVILSALGGNGGINGERRSVGGTGNGNGGNGLSENITSITPPAITVGQNGSVRMFNDSSFPIPGGGGGGGINWNVGENQIPAQYLNNNGQSFGGKGWWSGDTITLNIGSTPGYGGGAGGGAGYQSGGGGNDGSSGGNGAVFVRGHYAAEYVQNEEDDMNKKLKYMENGGGGVTLLSFLLFPVCLGVAA